MKKVVHDRQRTNAKEMERTCIGSKTSSHSTVHLEGIPPGGHSTPAVQQVVVTVCAIAMNSISVAQLRDAVV